MIWTCIFRGDKQIMLKVMFTFDCLESPSWLAGVMYMY